MSKRRRPRLPGTPAREPRHWWRGIVVSDSHCSIPNCQHHLHEHNPWAAFAYTVGIHDRIGLPELRLSATPRDCSQLPVMEVYALGKVLNIAAAWYVGDGGLPFAGTIHGWPGGYELRVDVPETLVALPQQEVECFQAHDDALVLPISWCAHRESAEHRRTPAA